MINVLTYHVKPFLLFGENDAMLQKSGAEWLRTSINILYNRGKARLHNAEVITDIFHNHDEKTGKTKPGYPLIIYHKIDNSFYITAINEGVETVKELLSPVTRPVEINKNLYMYFEVFKAEEIEVINTQTKNKYSITDWLPLNADTHKKYKTLALIEKIKFLEEILQKHIIYDFGKYLNLEISKTEVSISDVDRLKRTCMQYKGHDYLPFSLKFTANVNLPDFITLGNGKSFGYGMVKKPETNSSPD